MQNISIKQRGTQGKERARLPVFYPQFAISNYGRMEGEKKKRGKKEMMEPDAMLSATAWAVMTYGSGVLRSISGRT